jgi:sugar phosphate isomerase/epimerase
MKKTTSILACLALFFVATAQSNKSGNASVNPARDWKFGVALWTFHTVSFSQALDKVDSAGLKYIEPNNFTRTLPELKDSSLMQLSPSGIIKLKSLIEQRGLKSESVYLAGGNDVNSWKKQFEMAKQFGVKFVTAEPPVEMWDSIDSLAGIYGVKVAIHEHWKGMSRYWNPDTTLLAMKGHPNFGVCADLGHWPKSGINPLDAVKKLAGHIIAVHLKDIAAYNDPKLVDVPVGTGVIDFPAIFRELKKQGFKGHIYIERDATDVPSNLPSVIQEVKYYNEQVSKL